MIILFALLLTSFFLGGGSSKQFRFIRGGQGKNIRLRGGAIICYRDYLPNPTSSLYPIKYERSLKSSLFPRVILCDFSCELRRTDFSFHALNILRHSKTRETRPEKFHADDIQSWTKVLGQICTFGAFAHMPDTNTTCLTTRLWGINPTHSVLIPQRLVLRSVVLG